MTSQRHNKWVHTRYYVSIPTCALADCCMEKGSGCRSMLWSEWDSLPSSSSVLSLHLFCWSVADFPFSASRLFSFIPFLCHFLRAAVFSSFPPCCLLLSFGFLIRLGVAVACHQSFEVSSLSFLVRGMMLSSLLHKFVILSSRFITVGFFFITVQINSTNFKWISGTFFSPISASEGTWMITFCGFD